MILSGEVLCRFGGPPIEDDGSELHRARRKIVKGFRLLPKRHEFYEFFTSAAENAKLAAQALLRMANSLDQSEEFAKEIRRLEHEGDVITHRCVQVLNKTFMTPIDREDIHNLASAMDDIVDFIEAVSERLWLLGSECASD